MRSSPWTVTSLASRGAPGRKRTDARRRARQAVPRLGAGDLAPSSCSRGGRPDRAQGRGATPRLQPSRLRSLRRPPLGLAVPSVLGSMPRSAGRVSGGALGAADRRAPRRAAQTHDQRLAAQGKDGRRTGQTQRKSIMSEAAPFELSMRRLIRAPRERVYDALISADALRLWMGPRGMAVTEMTVDPRVGGAWRMAMCSRDG